MVGSLGDRADACSYLRTDSSLRSALSSAAARSVSAASFSASDPAFAASRSQAETRSLGAEADSILHAWSSGRAGAAGVVFLGFGLLTAAGLSLAALAAR